MSDEIKKDYFEDDEIYTLTDEEGKEQDFQLLGTCEIEGVEYLALVPVEEGSEPAEYVILKVEKDENGEEMLVTIDDDEEFDRVADLFEDNLFDEVDYDGEEK